MRAIWEQYKSTIFRNCTRAGIPRNSVQYWKDQLFAVSVTYLIPMSIVALVPGLYMAWNMGFTGMLAADFIAIASILGIALYPRLSLLHRKLIFNAALYMLAVVLLFYLGSHGPGMLYLLTVTIFVLVSLERFYGYLTLALNTLVCIATGVALHFGFASSPILQQYQLDSWIGVSSNLIFLSGTAVYLFPKLFEGLQTAFADQSKAEDKLRESLTEKETLLIEIHHRVKNNMAIVSGLLELQALDEDDPGLRRKLKGSVGRIKTMGSIHELLYRSDSFSRLGVDRNIRRLIDELIRTSPSSLDLQVDYKLHPVVLNINQAIPFSLVINEVATNAIKHAFNGRDRGLLSVSLSEQGDSVSFRLDDDGGGLPGKGKIADSGGLGMQLIDTLSTQLEADYTYRNGDRGTRFTIEFAKQDVKGPGNANLN